MKKVISVFLALMMCLSLAIPAFAVDTTGDISYNKPGETIDWGPKEPDMCLTLPTEIVVYDDRSGNYTVGATEVRNAGKAKATITDVQVSPSQGWSLSDWDATRGNVPVDAKTFSMRVFDAAVGSTGRVADTTAFPSLQKDASADMGVSFWMAPQRNIDGRPQVADVVVTAEFEDLSVYAILYDDGELVFQQGSTPEEGRTVTATYANVETATSCPWGDEYSSIKTVTFNCNVQPVSTKEWFGFFRNLTTINGIEKLDTSKVTSMESMFYNCENLTSLDVTGFDTSKVVNMYNMFTGCDGLTSLDVSGFDTSNVTNMSSMFSGCSGLTSLDVTGFDTSNVTNMSSMFRSCSGLTSLDVTGFDTSKVTSMSCMFWYCSKLTSLDVSSFDTSNVTNINNTFSDCSELTTIYASGTFVTTKVTNTSSNTFTNSSKLVGGNGTKYDSSHVHKEYARIDTADTPGYFTAKPISVTVEDHTNAAATVTEPSNGWRLGANTFSVSSEKVCAVGLLRNGACTELGYSSESGADHVFKADFQEGDAIVVVLRGDADVNGRLNVDDSSVIMRYLNGSYNASYAHILAMDVNHDGKVNGIDRRCVQLVSLDAYTPSWKSADAPEPQITELAGTFDNTGFTLGQSDTGETTGTLSFAFDDTTTRFDGFAIDFDWTELAGAADILAFYSGTYFNSTWNMESTVFTIAVTTDGVSGYMLYDGTSGSVDISTLSQFVSTVVGYNNNNNSKRDYELLELNFIFNGNLVPGTYEVPITIRELYDGSNPDTPVYYADENHPIHLTAVLEVPEMASATMDASMLDGMAAPGMDAVPELLAGDGTYEVDPDTEVVEVPETPIFDVEPETPEVPTEPSGPEEPAGDLVETPDEGATEPEPGEEPAEKPDDVPASPDVEPSQDPEPAAKPDEEDPAPDAGNQDGDGEGVPDTETPEDAQPPVDDGEAASNVPEEPGQD